MSAQIHRKRVPKLVFVPVLIVSVVLIVLVTIAPKLLSLNGSWTRIDDHTIALTGDIDSGNLLEFKLVFDENVTTVVLNSGGGLVYEAVQIGMILKDANVNIVVDGVCLSSCANYLFTAGRWKMIRNGVVGFHGDAQALEKQAGTKAAIESQLSGLSSAEREAYQAELAQTLIWERTFFADLGIDQALFERTQRPDKGMADGKTYALLLPTPDTFVRYGVRNVEGVQSLKIKQELEEELSLPLLID